MAYSVIQLLQCCNMSIQNYFPDELRYKIILIGDCGAGKTSIFWRYIKNQQPLDVAVTAVDFRYKQIKVKDKTVRLCIWDTAGQEKYRSIVATYFKSCDGVVLVFDLANKKSWDGIKQIWYDMAQKRVPNANYMLLGSKKDLGIQVDLKEVNKWCAEKGIYFIQTSAKTGEHVEQAFFTLAALIDSRKQISSQVSTSFASSSSRYVKTQTTKEPDSARKTEGRGNYKLQFSKASSNSFYLKRQKNQKKLRKKQSQECCK